MKIIKIRFVDFSKEFEDFFLKILNKRYKVVFSDTPDYLFFSVYGSSYLDYDCIRIFYTAEQISPDFDIADYAIGFDYMDFEDRYMRYPYYLLRYSKEVLENLHLTSLDIKDHSSRKFSSFVVGNKNALTGRDEFFHSLSGYKQVDSGGKHLNNVGSSVYNKIQFLKGYKFNIAYENSRYNGYTTEKIADAFVSGTVPIYFGNPLISSEFNPKSFVNVHNFEDNETLVDYIKYLDNNVEEYLKLINEPKILENSNVPSMLDLEDFLYSVLDQEISSAIRRPHSLTVIRKEFILRFISRLTKFYYTIPSPIRSLLKPIRPKYK